LVPGLVLQSLAVATALSYFYYGPMRNALDQLSLFRIQTGFVYSCVATAIFGGALPCLYLWLQPATRGRYRFAQSAALTLWWAYKGIEVDLFYRTLARVVGAEANLGTVATKVLIDQIVYSPIWAVTSATFFYQFVESNFDFRALWADLRAPRWYQRRALPNLVSNLGIWVPSVCVIYSLPSSLQIPLFNLVLCFYTLLLAHVAAQQAPHPLRSVGEPPVPVG
jgi:hypothetical protein